MDSTPRPPSTSKVRKNLVANLLGGGWSLLSQLFFVPLYLHFLGAEAFGLIGVFIALQLILVVLDLGLATTVNREIARSHGAEDRPHRIRTLVRTLEVIYWMTALFIGVALVLGAPAIVENWINAEQLSDETVTNSTRLLGIALALMWPSALYAGALMGLQRQVGLNVIKSVTVTARGGGAVLLLWLVSPSIELFFQWQIAVLLAQTLALAMYTWRCVPAGQRPRFDADTLRSVWRFAAGMTVISALGLLLSQLDKIVLTKLLPLQEYGYYALAATVATGLARLVQPVFASVFPRLAELVARSDDERLRQIYHRATQALVVLVVPVAVVIAFFSHEVLFAWTGSLETAERTSTIVTLLIIGQALNGLATVPYAMQLAHGWTSLPLYTNLVAAILVVPSLILVAREYGAVGAASIWVALNAGYVLIQVQIMHFRLLPTERWRWYFVDVLPPVGAAVAAASAARLLLPDPTTRLSALVTVGIALAAAQVAASLLAGEVRNWALKFTRLRS